MFDSVLFLLIIPAIVVLSYIVFNSFMQLGCSRIQALKEARSFILTCALAVACIVLYILMLNDLPMR